MVFNEKKVKYEIPQESYIRLKYSWDMILCLEDFINCIALHKKDLKSLRNVGLINFNRDFLNNKNFNPAGVLKDYIYLEANSFFKCAKKLKLSKGMKDILDLPNYLKELENFRDIMVAHRDVKEKSNFPEGWLRLLQHISKLIPIKTLVKDVDDYFNQLQSN